MINDNWEDNGFYAVCHEKNIIINRGGMSTLGPSL